MHQASLSEGLHFVISPSAPLYCRNIVFQFQWSPLLQRSVSGTFFNTIGFTLKATLTISLQQKRLKKGQEALKKDIQFLLLFKPSWNPS